MLSSSKTSLTSVGVYPRIKNQTKQPDFDAILSHATKQPGVVLEILNLIEIESGQKPHSPTPNLPKNISDAIHRVCEKTGLFKPKYGASADQLKQELLKLPHAPTGAVVATPTTPTTPTGAVVATPTTPTGAVVATPTPTTPTAPVVATPTAPVAITHNDSCVQLAHQNGFLAARAACPKEIIEVMTGTVQMDTTGTDFQYKSVSVLVKSAVQTGMRLFGSEDLAFVLDMSRAPVWNSSTPKRTHCMVGLFGVNAATCSMGGSRGSKQTKSTAFSLPDLAKSITTQAQNSPQPITNSEVLCVGVDPSTVNGILVRPTNYDKVPQTLVFQNLHHVLTSRDNRPGFSTQGQILAFVLPVYLYDERLNKLVMLDCFDATTGTAKTPDNLQAEFHANFVSLRQPKTGSVSIGINSTLYPPNAHTQLQALNSIAAKTNFNLLALISKLAHPHIGYFRMTKFTTKIQGILNETNSTNRTVLINELHALIDIDSIEFNLQKNGNTSTLDINCITQLKTLPHILRRELIRLTTPTASGSKFVPINVDEVMAFVTVVTQTIETISSQPITGTPFTSTEKSLSDSVVTRLAVRERYDQMPHQIHSNLFTSLNLTPTDNTVSPPTPIDQATVDRQIQAVMPPTTTSVSMSTTASSGLGGTVVPAAPAIHQQQVGGGGRFR